MDAIFDLLLAFALTKVSFGSATTSQLEKSAAIPRRLLSEVAGSLVEVSGKFDLSQHSVVMGHIVMDKLSEDATAPKVSEAFPTRAMVIFSLLPYVYRKLR